MAKLFLK